MVQRNPRLLLYLFAPLLSLRHRARARAFMPGISSVFSRNQYSGCTETLMYSRLTSCPNRAASWRTDESIPRNWELVFCRLMCIYYIYINTYVYIYIYIYTMCSWIGECDTNRGVYSKPIISRCFFVFTMFIEGEMRYKEE